MDIIWHECKFEMPEMVLPAEGKKSLRVIVAVRKGNGSYTTMYNTRVRYNGRNGVIKWKWYKNVPGVITHWAEEIGLPKEILNYAK